MTRFVLTAVVVAGMVAGGRAQAPVRPDFSGEWVLDAAKTTLTGLPMRVEGPGRGASSGTTTPPVKISGPGPRYPPDAQRDKITGLVVLEAIITAKGDVAGLELLRPVHPLLDAAALEAVQQWKYRPATREGQPIDVIMTVTVTFNISGAPPAQPGIAFRGRGGGTVIGVTPGGRGTGSGGGGGGGMGPAPMTLQIQQTNDGLMIRRPFDNEIETATYRFDGRRVRNRLNSLGGLASKADLTFVSAWEGPKLLTQMTWESFAGPQNRLETMWLEGETLMVELSRPPLQLGGEPIKRTTVYSRKKQLVLGY